MSDDWRSCRWPAQLPLQTNKDCRQVPIIQLYCKTVPPMISFLDTKLMEPAMAGVHFSQRSILTMAMDTSIRLSASWKKWRMGNKSAILWLFHFGTNHNSNIYEPEDNMWVSSRSIHRLVYFTLDNVWYWTPIDYKVWNWGGAATSNFGQFVCIHPTNVIVGLSDAKRNIPVNHIIVGSRQGGGKQIVNCNW
jgi:hypothetical protein